eukprot:GDKI01002342.1.p1 GENE.GDKI01002342.1~~GDKI01002342.1.p1  ORF type:complete len:217 (+),score=60.97 GDKI01002342.1:101-751(+)
MSRFAFFLLLLATSQLIVDSKARAPALDMGVGNPLSFVDHMMRDFDETFNALAAFPMSLTPSQRRAGSPFLVYQPTAGALGHSAFKDEKTHYTFEADVPGVRQEDVKLSISPERIFTVEASRKCSKKPLIPPAEQTPKEGTAPEDKGQSAAPKVVGEVEECGYFKRSFTLPTDADFPKATARLEHGVLCVQLPKRDKPEETAFVVPWVKTDTPTTA